MESPYAIGVEGSLRGRHPLRISFSLKMAVMKARVEVRHDFFNCACNVRTTRLTALLPIDTVLRTYQFLHRWIVGHDVCVWAKQVQQKIEGAYV